MKTTSLVAGALFLLVSGSALAAGPKAVSEDQASQLQEMGTVQVSGIRGSTDDAIHALKAKAAKDDAGYYRIVSLGSPSDASTWSGTAIIYK